MSLVGEWGGLAGEPQAASRTASVTAAAIVGIRARRVFMGRFYSKTRAQRPSPRAAPDTRARGKNFDFYRDRKPAQPCPI